MTMTASLRSAVTMPSGAAAMSPRGLLVAARDLSLNFVLPYVALLVLHAALDALPVVLGRALALVGPALVLAWLLRRRSPYALWAAFLLALQVHATLWAAIPSVGVPVRYGYAIALDRVLGLGRLPTALLQSWHASTPHALDVLAFGVYASFFAAPVLGFLGLWRRERDAAAAYARAMTCASFLSLAVMVALPTAPPWMASDRGMIAPIERIGELVVGPAVHETAEDIIGVNEVAAMPSLHMAMTVLVALAAASAIPTLRRWWWVYPLAMGLSLVYLGEHYAVDVLAGVAVAWLGWRLALTPWGPFALRPRERDGTEPVLEARAA